MARSRGTSADRLWPAALALLATAACMQTRYVVVGPQPAPCTDSISARVARLPAESVSVADREHALWAQTQCKAALDSLQRAAAQQAPTPAGAPSGARPSRARTSATWPPPACKDSIAARVARMPADSVSAADREHAARAQQECEQELAAPPPAAANPASSNPTAAVLIGVAVVALLALVF